MERVDFRGARLSWRTIETKRKNAGATKQWQVTIRWKEQVGTDADGTPVMKERRKSKLFPAGQALDTGVKRRHATDQWINELEDEQERRIEEAEAETKEAKRAARAEARRRKQRKADELARALPSGRSLVSFYVDSYLDDAEASGSIEKVTVMSYRQSAKNIARGFPDARLDELTPTMIQKWENALIREGRHPGTVLKYHKLFSLVCKHAVIVDDLVKNPAWASRPPSRARRCRTPSPRRDSRGWLAQLRSWSPRP